MDKVASVQEQVTNESRKMRILRKNQRETLEIKKKKVTEIESASGFIVD